MEKTIKIGNKEVRLKSTAGTMTRYRNNFGRDFIKDLISLQEKLNEKIESGKEFQAIDLDMFEKIAWAMAKTADDNIPDIEKWLDDFETFDIMKVLPVIMEMLVQNMTQVDKPVERVTSKKRNVEVNSNTIVLRCLKFGMTIRDMDNVTIGFILDLIEENNREVQEADEPIVADADTLHRFFK